MPPISHSTSFVKENNVFSSTRNYGAASMQQFFYWFIDSIFCRVNSMSKHTKGRLERPIVICICGLPGSGKSTAAKKIAKAFQLKYYSGGDALKALAVCKSCTKSICGWWEGEEGIQFLNKRYYNFEFDKEVDKQLMEIAKRGNVVLDSRTMPWLLENGFKIWLAASWEKRVERIVQRDGISVGKASRVLKHKEKRTKAIYKKLYGFSIGEDFAPFHLILDTDVLTADEVFKTLYKVIKNLMFN
jgi:cytidylate kinase